jgi:hypothetical protein
MRADVVLPRQPGQHSGPSCASRREDQAKGPAMLSVKRRMDSVKRVGGSEPWDMASLKGWQASLRIRSIQRVRSLCSRELSSRGPFRRSAANPPPSAPRLVRRRSNSSDALREARVSRFSRVSSGNFAVSHKSNRCRSQRDLKMPRGPSRKTTRKARAVQQQRRAEINGPLQGGLTKFAPGQAAARAVSPMVPQRAVNNA